MITIRFQDQLDKEKSLREKYLVDDARAKRAPSTTMIKFPRLIELSVLKTTGGRGMIPESVRSP